MNRKLVVQIVLIVVLLLVTGAIVHMLLVKSNRSRGGKVIVHGTYHVSLTEHTDPNLRKFKMNDFVAPTIKLRRGVYYEFRNTCDEPLYFSSDAHGGPGAPGNLAKHKKDFKGLANGTIFFLITDDLPDKFYYQSGLHKDVGGIVEVF